MRTALGLVRGPLKVFRRMFSCLYEGVVFHTRYEPFRHGFSYRMMQPMLHLQELSEAFKSSRLWSSRSRAVVQFKRSDHYGPEDEPLEETIATLVEQRTGTKPDGRIMLLSHPRYFGFVFNPVSFYYCYNLSDVLVAIVAEVDNTPWGERHMYVLPAKANQPLYFEFDKAFHVSPFMPMKQRYVWQFNAPGETLEVFMKSYDDDRCVFEAELQLQRKAISRASLHSTLVRYPLMTAKVMGAIYWQAARLALRRAPFFTHPNKGEQPA